METLNFEIKRKEYAIGNTGRSIFLDLGDLNFIDRLEQARENIYSRLQEQTKGKTPDTELTAEEAITQYELMKEDDKFIKEQLNYAFDYDVSSAVFGAANCMTTDDKGICYFERFLEVILPEVEKEYNVRMKVVQSRATQKYTAQKGKHSK